MARRSAQMLAVIGGVALAASTAYASADRPSSPEKRGVDETSLVAAAREKRPDPELGPRLGRDEAVENRARRALGARYVCMTTPRKPERIVFVSDPRGLTIARHVFDQVSGARRTSQARIADQANRRRSSANLVRISDRLERTIPQSGRRQGTVNVLINDDASPTRCPKIVIALDKRGVVGASVVRWAHAAQNRFGRDRVKIRFDALGGEGT